jgi:hypothetical protein
LGSTNARNEKKKLQLKNTRMIIKGMRGSWPQTQVHRGAHSQSYFS